MPPTDLLEPLPDARLRGPRRLQGLPPDAAGRDHGHRLPNLGE
jgi:hypothetical protein